MAQVDFYLLKEQHLTARHIFACKIIEKAYQQNLRVFVYAVDQTEAQLFDDLLWTFKDTSFIPHVIIEENPALTAPVQIGYQAIPNNQAEMLLNLTLQFPQAYAQFQRIIEICLHDEELRAGARQLYRQYRDVGCAMKLHDLSKIA